MGVTMVESKTDINRSVRVLVVDDEPEICDLMKQFLDESGYDVRIAYNGESCVDIVKNFSPHFILLDIMMPGMNGIETLVKIRELDKVAVVVMVTALHDITMARDAIDIGASDYITKPIDLKYLLDYLARVSAEIA